MDRIRILFIINSKAGTDSKRQVSRIIKRRFSNKKYRMSFYYTAYPNHAYELSKEYKNKRDIIVAVGGDGTVNEVARGLIDSETMLGIIPMGSGNGLARSLGIPISISRSIELIKQQQFTAIDCAYLNDTPFFCTAGFGFDAYIAHQFALTNKRGLKKYIQIGLKSYFNYTSLGYKIEINEKIINTDAYVLSVANANQFGNNAYISPKSSLTDQQLELCIIKKPRGIIKGIKLLRRLFKLNIDQDSHVEIIPFTSCKIIPKGKCFIHIDGEPQNSAEALNISVKEKAITVIH